MTAVQGIAEAGLLVSELPAEPLPQSQIRVDRLAYEWPSIRGTVARAELARRGESS